VTRTTERSRRVKMRVIYKYILVMATVPNQKTAQKMAKELLEQRLAACVTVSAACQSHYWWQGRMATDKEHILFIKTRGSLYGDLEKKILKIHPYKVPEIIALPLVKGYGKYLDWISMETKRRRNN
jgi:periplasmic divalent cation tolerance protein